MTVLLRKSKAALVRELKAACELAARRHERLKEVERLHTNAMDCAERIRQELEQAEARIVTLKIENAELHGYVNRVELEDDAAWHNVHGVEAQTGRDTDAKVTIPPLRQRLRGARFDQPEPRDTFTSHGGRPGRTRFPS